MDNRNYHHGQRNAATTELQIFLTYAQERNESTARDVYSWLMQNGFKKVKAEFNSAKIIGLNKNAWYDEALDSDFVLVFIDEYYKETACNYVPTETSDDEKQSESQYVFDHIQTTIVHNGCMNNKFIPILMQGATRGNIPMALQTSEVYKWPMDKAGLLNRLMGRSQFLPPPKGPCPVAKWEPARDHVKPAKFAEEKKSEKYSKPRKKC